MWIQRYFNRFEIIRVQNEAQKIHRKFYGHRHNETNKQTPVADHQNLDFGFCYTPSYQITDVSVLMRWELRGASKK